MGVWRYCSCGAGLHQIDLEDLEAISWDDEAKVKCPECHEERDDDTPSARINVLLRELIALRTKAGP